MRFFTEMEECDRDNGKATQLNTFRIFDSFVAAPIRKGKLRMSAKLLVEAFGKKVV